jgi:hypothetical protein
MRYHKRMDKKVLDEYKKNADDILKRMYEVVVRSRRKRDDKSYKRIINTLKDDK